jgi:23S rRNA (cytosine1962-C5)-methyltransferase
MKIYLKRNEERRIRNGHLWVFSNEIDRVDGEAQNGDLVSVFDSSGKLIGCGFYNKNSLISVRILSFSVIDDLNSLLKSRLRNAYNLRNELYPNRNSFRMVFSESDFLPGLIIDKYNQSFVLQTYSFGMQKSVDSIVKILKDDFNANNIFTKNESHFRKLEGLPESDEIYLGEKESEIINDGFIFYDINFDKSQKTGFYFDQNDNRFFIHKLVEGKSVLDAFCNSGGFGLHTAKAGAKTITFVDSSLNEINNVKRNYSLNELKVNADFVTADVFDYLEQCRLNNKKYDVIIVDPPAFAKSRKDIPTAKKGYEKLNKLSLNVLNDGGYLATSSCSYHINQNDFIAIINSAAAKSGKKIQLIHFNSASLDHPQLPSMPETVYLKFAVFKVYEL